ncbi:hypothetical protein [Streptomyces sp. GSL17-111]|uniref:hypothetical protein n=1 Tax=Streptomyces sp. GSL17-111 TaxID=3121596 RepID=UPI0030F3E752
MLAHPLAAGHEIVLGRHRAWTPRLAVRWLRGQAARLADALDPVPGRVPFPAGVLRPVLDGSPDPGGVLRAWLADHALQEEQLASLRSGRRVGVTARDAELLYSLSAQPIPADALQPWGPLVVGAPVARAGVGVP